MPLIAKIAVSAATYAIDKPYDYLLAEDSVAKEGCRVLVPFGRGNRTSEGMILSLRRGVSVAPAAPAPAPARGIGWPGPAPRPGAGRGGARAPARSDG